MKTTATTMNEQENTPADADDEPDSPVFILQQPDRFEAELIIHDRHWLDLVGADQRAAMIAAISASLEAAACPWAEMSILLADDARLAHLNETHRGKPGPTNVLSFPDDDADGPIGDIAIAYETVIAEAQDQGKAAADHLLHLVVHGVLHLLGHDHHDDDEAETMEQLEISILAGLGITNPYQEAVG